jgi:serine/threonine protein kinase
MDEEFLLKEIKKFYKKNIQMKSCSKGTNKLRNLLCLFANEYPLQGSIKNQKLVLLKKEIGKGSYGAVYESTDFQGIPIVTKTFFNKENTYNIIEVFVSFVLLNKILLLNPKLCKNLVPTYGIFCCTHKYENKKLKSICDSDGPKFYHMVQKRIDGKPFHDILNSNITLSNIQKIVKAIFSTLYELNEYYYISHNDLHSGNILIDKDFNPYLIDFGFASFKIGSHYYYSNNDEYNIKTYSGKDMKSGIRDFLNVTRSIIKRSKDKDIIEYTKGIEKKVLDQLLETPISKFHKSKYRNYQYIYQTLQMIESSLSQEDREIVHSHNLKTLKRITYRYILDII